MSPEFISTLVNIAPQVAIVFLFLWFKADENKRNQRREEIRDSSFIKAINATTVAVTKGMELVGSKVDGVDRKVDKLHEEHKEDREIMEKMYKHSVDVYKGRKRTVNVAVSQTS